MRNISNWKFKKWVDWIKKSPSDIPTDAWNYINLEIYPEDIEIMSIIFMPTTFEYRDVILLNVEGVYEKEIGENFDNGLLNIPNITEVQESMNRLIVTHVFFDNYEKSSDSTLMNVANLIKHNWEYYLIKKYPNRKFTVEIVGDAFDPVVTFYEVP